MRQQIFKDAEKLKSKVVFEGSGRKLYFYSFKDLEDAPVVSIEIADGKTMLRNCTCTQHSIHGGISPETLCSYNCAVIKALPLK